MTSVEDLVAVVDRLLDPEHGCVWNRGQTHATLARYAVEEAYELVDAIDDGNADDLREELGDVLYQVVLHAGIAARQGQFTFEDVAESVREKMVRRHPHVFGDEEARSVEDVVRVWRAAKAQEKSARASVFDGVPRAMPPLERATKLVERLAERGDLHAALASVPDEVGSDAVATGAVVADGIRPSDGGAVSPDAAVAGPGSEATGVPDAEVDPAWGAALLAEIAAAHERGVDPAASLRAAVVALEAAGRRLERA